MPLNYIGSKRSLLDFLNHVKSENTENVNTIGDLFAGTGSVGTYFSENYPEVNIISNDTEYYSYVINYANLINIYSPEIEEIITKLNDLPGKSGLIHQTYSPKGERLYFTEENAKKIDSIREYIEKYKNKEFYYFLLASLIEAADKIANVSCVYGAFLKKFKKSASKPIIIKPIHKKTVQNSKNVVLQKDIKEVNQTFDLVYLDPPYNSRQYSANYFVLNYIAHYNPEIKIKGKTGIFCEYFKSDYCSKVKAKETFKSLIKSLKTRYIMLSYNNEGILKPEEIKEILLKEGRVVLYEKQYKKFKAQKNVKENFVYEYCYLLDKKKPSFFQKN